MEEGENVIHPVGQPANELVLKVGGENLHTVGLTLQKQGVCEGRKKFKNASENRRVGRDFTGSHPLERAVREAEHEVSVGIKRLGGALEMHRA